MSIRDSRGVSAPDAVKQKLQQAADKKAAKSALDGAIQLGRKQRLADPKDANDATGHLNRMRGIKRGGTAPLPWEGASEAEKLTNALEVVKGKPPVAPRLTAPKVDTEAAIDGAANAIGGGVATAQPGGVKQAEGKNTCAAANKQRAMAEHDPAAYSAMVKQLVKTGSATLPNGETLRLSALNKSFIDGLIEVTPAERENMKVQAALMDYANGIESYDMATDLSTKFDGSTHAGLTAKQAQRLDQLDGSTETKTAEGLQDDVYKSRNFFMQMLQSVFQTFGYDGPGFVSAVSDVVRDEFKRSREENRDFSLALKWPGGETPTHMVTVTDVADDGQVTVRDTTGEATYSRDAFADLLPRDNDDGIGGDTTMSTTSTAPPPPPPRPRR